MEMHLNRLPFPQKQGARHGRTEDIDNLIFRFRTVFRPVFYGRLIKLDLDSTLKPTKR